MMFVIGAFLLLLGILFDEGTTLILFLQGFEVMETNPIYLLGGIGGLLGFLIVSYSFFLFSWNYVLKTNRFVIEKKFFYHKWHDIFVFMFCFLIVALASTKVMIGINHIGIMFDYQNDPVYKADYDNAQNELKILRTEQPEQFNKFMIAQYKEIAFRWSYLQIIFNVLFAFMFFKVGYKTVPWDMA